MIKNKKTWEQAVSVHGEPRLPKDIDITVGLNINGLEKILKIAKKLKFKLLVSDPEKFVKETVALKRANKTKIDRTYINFASVEDLIIHKIVWGRERDIEDVKKILIKNKNVDFDYVLNWLKNFEGILEENLVQKFLNLKREIGL